MIALVPEVRMPKRANGKPAMKGRPITPAEFEKMLVAADVSRSLDADAWKRYLRGLWLSGLRLEESLVLSWERSAGISVDLEGKHPCLRIWAQAEKGNRDRLLPMTPDFAEFLLRTPVAERSGPVFKLNGFFVGDQMSIDRVSRNVSAIGKRAGVVVNHETGKFASAHDLRRAFGTRWAARVKPVILQKLMRHKSIEVTMKYYVELEADELAAELWKEFGRDTVKSGG